MLLCMTTVRHVLDAFILLEESRKRSQQSSPRLWRALALTRSVCARAANCSVSWRTAVARIDKRRKRTWARKLGAVTSSSHGIFARIASSPNGSRTRVTSFTNSDAPKAICRSFTTCSTTGDQANLRLERTPAFFGF